MAEIMKDSGQEWIGAIPNTWTITKNKYVLNSVYSGGTPTATNSNYYCDDGYPFVNIADMSTVDYVSETNKYLTKDGLLDKNLRVLPSGTILYSMYATLGHVSELKIDAAISQAMLALFVDYKRMNKHFYKYNMMAASDYAISSAAGTTQMNLNAEKVINYVLVMPPINEQKAIADFLDDKCAEVDKLSEDIQKQIEILEEYKKSVITRAVTKGLDSNVEMKDSGIQWIGKIPTNWTIIPVKYVFEIENGSDPKTDDGDTPVYGSGSRSFKKCVEYKQGPTVLLGRKGTVNIPQYIEGKYWNVDTAFNTKAKGGYDLKLFYYAACCFDYESYATQTALPSMTQFNYYNIRLPLMPKDEQIKIVDYLNKKCGEIDLSIGVKNEQLEKLADYKKSIIYEYVTGKKRVKGAK